MPDHWIVILAVVLVVLFVAAIFILLVFNAIAQEVNELEGNIHKELEDRQSQ